MGDVENPEDKVALILEIITDYINAQLKKNKLQGDYEYPKN